MKKLLTFGLSIFIFLSGLSPTGAEEKKVRKFNPNKNSHVVYYIPHQDDEALTFGLSIMNHVKAGHNVHIVLMTDGTASFVRKKLNMTELEFSKARNREFSNSLDAMNIDPKNIDYRNIKDGALTVADVEKVVKEYEKKYPKAKHKTFSWTDPHSDHANLGVALKKLEKAGVVSDARYYVKRDSNPEGIRLTTERYVEAYKPSLLSVSTAYKVEDSKRGLYGIGYKSVKKSFIAFEKQPLSRYHR